MDKFSPFLETQYPENIKILQDPYLTHLCSVASQQSCVQPQFNRVVKAVFQHLMTKILNHEWPQETCTHPTRMTDLHPELRLETQRYVTSQKAVCVDVARAGMLPSQVFMDTLNDIMDPVGLRHDHIFAARITNDKGEVTHTELASSKVGGDVDKAMLLIPDPMGATGHSLCEVIDYYKEKTKGTPAKIISAHMIITPEFVRKLSDTHPDVIVYAARLDRGFSSDKALASPPGTHWDEESGLNDSQYIVPGAGGVGELINNSFV
jgi:uracil phosphoribosyltransferase